MEKDKRMKQNDMNNKKMASNSKTAVNCFLTFFHKYISKKYCKNRYMNKIYE